jgi:hypothetical protein
MFVGKSPTFSKPSPSNLRSQQGRIPASASEGQKSRGHAADGRLQPAADLRLPIVECRFAKLPHPRRLTNTRTEARKWALTLRDVKNEGTSGDVYENKRKGTKCLVTNPASYTKMHPSHANRQQSVGLLGPTYTSYAIKRDGRR